MPSYCRSLFKQSFGHPHFVHFWRFLYCIGCHKLCDEIDFLLIGKLFSGKSKRGPGVGKARVVATYSSHSPAYWSTKRQDSWSCWISCFCSKCDSAWAECKVQGNGGKSRGFHGDAQGIVWPCWGRNTATTVQQRWSMSAAEDTEQLDDF